MKRVRTPCCGEVGKLALDRLARGSPSATRPRRAGAPSSRSRTRRRRATRSPRSIAASTVRRSARVPGAVARRRRAGRAPSAQRPLPSMMIATAARRASGARGRVVGAPCSSEVGAGGAQTSMISASLCFRRSSIDFTWSSVSFCTCCLGAALLVVADVAVRDELLQVLHHVAADVADRDLAVLGDPAHDLDELLAPLLGELRDRQPDRSCRRSTASGRGRTPGSPSRSP